MVELRILRRCNLSMTLHHFGSVIWSTLSTILYNTLIGRLFVDWVHFDSIQPAIGIVSTDGSTAAKNRSRRFAIRKE